MSFMDFRKEVNSAVDRFIASQRRLLVTNIKGDDLWRHYLESFPEGTNPLRKERTQHDCDNCKNFIRNFGGVVVVTEDGQRLTLWDDVQTPVYEVVAKRMRQLLLTAPIESVYTTDQPSYGRESNVGFDTNRYYHFFTDKLPEGRVYLEYGEGKLRSDLNVRRQIYARGLKEIKMPAIDILIELCDGEMIYKWETMGPQLRAFKKFRQEYDKLTNEFAQDEFAWATFEACEGAWLYNSVTGELLDKLGDNVPLEDAIRSYESMTAPTNYKRPKALVTKAQVEQARKTIDKLGLSASLDRRVALWDDLPAGIALFRSRPKVSDALSDVLGSVPTKPTGHTKGKSISRQEFEEKLQQADEAELYLSGSLSRRMATIVTAAQSEAPNLFKWNNHFSWSYVGDLTDVIRERVKEAGGRVEAEVCIRLAWENYDDLDLHVVEVYNMHNPQPTKTHIYYMLKGQVTFNGGMLDVDANGGAPQTRSPVENVTYATRAGMSPGVYGVAVNQYEQREGRDGGFKVEIEVMGEKTMFEYPKSLGTRDMVKIAELIVDEHHNVTVVPLLDSQAVSSEVWGVKTNGFVPISAVFPSPNVWDANDVGMRHLFVTLEGCVNPGDARGFYNEFLRPEFNEHRKVMEIVGGKVRAASANERQLSGVGLTSGTEATFKLTTKGQSQLYNVRF